MFEKEHGMTQKNVVVVMDYMVLYSKYYKLKGVTTMVSKIFDIDKVEKGTTIYVLAYKNNNRDIEGKRITLPDDTQLIRIDK